ncbi:MAG TPA: alpha-2-macroglobulin family protein, partial [Thermoanaerobaculia bacterium]|nr:alpha-2-macroglobulin family protein [Thermoanaerobaculia bacterium]
PYLRPDGLKFYGGYAIGGPGQRGMAGGIQTMSRMAAPASANAREDAAAVRRAKAAAEEPERKEKDALAVPLRSAFAETAFWQPHLLTGPDGTASIEFTVPDSVTSWNVFVHAVTRDWKAGSIKKETKSVKDLMVRPYVPRFLREGDRAELKVVVNNASDKAMSGRVAIDILDAETNASVLASFGVSPEKASLPFTVAAGGGANVTLTLAAPKRVGLYAFKITAISGDTSDGELRPVPVLPGRMHLMQSRFAALRDRDRRELVFADLAANDDPTRINEQMVVTVDAQLFYSVLQALPYLVNYPYECTEQTLNRFVSTGIVSSLFRDYPAVAKMAEEMSRRDTQLETWDGADANRKMALEETPWLENAKGGRDTGLSLSRVLDPRVAKAEREASLAKLRKAQTQSGGFPWWPGGPPSTYMTVYILHGFANALEFGAEVPKDMVQKAWGYAGMDVRRSLDECIALDHGLCHFATFVNYTLSSYPDESWYKPAFDAAYRKKLLDYSFSRWKLHPPYLKGQLALTLKRMGRSADAKLVWDSVMDSAKTERDFGTYWAPEDRSWLWYNDTIETQAFALRTLSELEPQSPTRAGLAQWLMLNKKLNQWKSTRATAEVIYSLAYYLKKEGALGIREDATVTVGGQKTVFVFEPDRYTGKKNQVVVPGDKLDPKTASTVVVEKEGKGLAFASATWHFSTDKLPEEGRGDFFAVSRRYFKREATPQGFVLKPLAEGTPVSPGDEVEVQISLWSKHAAEYVHLRDPRAAGLEPGISVSRWKWDLGLVYYEETRDSGANFFFEQLPAGEYTFKYRLRANMAGTFKVGPATVQSMYAPEFAAYSAGNTVTVK